MIWLLIIFYIIPALLVLDFGVVVFRCIREDNDDNKAPIGIFLLVLLVSFFPIANLFMVGYCINMLIEDENCREDYGRLSMLGQLFSTRI